MIELQLIKKMRLIFLPLKSGAGNGQDLPATRFREAKLAAVKVVS